VRTPGSAPRRRRIRRKAKARGARFLSHSWRARIFFSCSASSSARPFTSPTLITHRDEYFVPLSLICARNGRPTCTHIGTLAASPLSSFFFPSVAAQEEAPHGGAKKKFRAAHAR
jgi:hypothetical protein